MWPGEASFEKSVKKSNTSTCTGKKRYKEVGVMAFKCHNEKVFFAQGTNLKGLMWGHTGENKCNTCD